MRVAPPAALLFLVGGLVVDPGCAGEGEGANDPPGAREPSGEGGIPGAGPSGSGGGARWATAKPLDDRVVAEAPARAVPTPGALASAALPFDLRVVAVHVTAGDRVTAGAPLVDVAPPEVLAAAARLGPAATRTAVLRERLALLQGLREDELVEAGRVAVLQTELADAQSALGVAHATLSAAGVSPGRASTVAARGHLALVAPVAGLVRVVRAVPGEVRAAGAPALVELVGSAAVRVEARFAGAPPADDVRGLAAALVVPALAEPVALRWPPVSRAVSPEDGTFLVWLDGSGDAALPAITPGTAGVVQLRAGVRGDDEDDDGMKQDPSPLLVVPAGAIGLREGEARVLVDGPDGEGVSARRVEVLVIDGDRAVVRGQELAAGDRVAADPALLLGPGLDPRAGAPPEGVDP